MFIAGQETNRAEAQEGVPTIEECTDAAMGLQSQVGQTIMCAMKSIAMTTVQNTFRWPRFDHI